MIDQNVVRGKTQDGQFAAFLLKVDGNRVFSDYGLEYINRTAKLMLVKAFAQQRRPEEMDAEIKELVCSTVSKAAYHLALQEVRRLLELGAEGVRQVVMDVMEGNGEE